MRDPRKQQKQHLQPEDKWEANEEIHEREVGGEEEPQDDGCFKRVLRGRQLRLPESLTRAGSLPRRFARSVTPTPRGQEPQPADSAHNESGHLSVGSSHKRAASTSPSRNEFRRSLRDRLPRRLRYLLSTKGSRNSRLPPKPARKAGPVGRSWVKVYEDITYMDDSEQEYYPVVGYTGSPYRIPDAYPLPIPPTPPPARQAKIARRTSPTPSQMSEYDNVSKEEIMLNQKPNEANATDETLVRPTARRKENSRFKGRRQKRSGTPVAEDRLTNGTSEFHDALENTVANQTFENIMYDNGQSEKRSDTVEDDYIIPEQSPAPPARPKRGTKIYETISDKEIPSETTNSEPIPSVTSDPLTVEVSTSVETTESVPPRPTRGVKIYESIRVSAKVEPPLTDDFAAVVVGQSVSNDTTIEKQEETHANDTIETHSLPNSEEVPTKPKRGMKLYEDVKPTNTKENDEIKEDISVAVCQSSNSTEIIQEEIPPSKPSRGTKLYSSMKFESASKQEQNINENFQILKENNKENIDSFADNNVSVFTPRYTKVHKDKNNQLKPVNTAPSEVAPPIPPKKRGSRAGPSNEINVEDTPPPPRPSRNLKPRTRSADAKTCAKRKITETTPLTNGYIDSNAQIDNTSPPKKPKRGSHNKASVPPRRKKNTAGDPLIATMTIETGKAAQVTVVPEDLESYENINIHGEPRINFRSRPLPPTPDDNTTHTAKNELNNTMKIVETPATTTIRTETSSNISAVASAAASHESQHCRSSTEGAEPANVDATHVSTADDSVVSGAVVVAAAAGASGLDRNLEQDIDVNLNNIETSFATLDTVLKSIQSLPSDKTVEVSNGSQNNQAVCTQSSVLSGCPTTSDKNASDKVVQSVGQTNATNEAQHNEERNRQYNETIGVCEKVDGHQVTRESYSEAVITNECEQKTSMNTADVSSVAISGKDMVQPAEQQLITSAQEMPHKNVNSSIAVENRQIAEELSAVAITVEGNVESVNESVAVEEIPESVSVSSHIVYPKRKLSIAAENISMDISESLDTNDAVSSYDNTSDAASVSDETVGRKISVAAETVVLEFMPETAKALTDSCCQTEAVTIVNEIPESLSVPQVVTEGRKLSVGAENLTSDLSESLQVAEEITNSASIDSTPESLFVPAQVVTQGRKLSVGAENLTSDLSESLQVAEEITNSAGLDSTQESLFVPAQVVTQGRQLSVGAENLTSDLSESLQVAEEIANSSGMDASPESLFVPAQVVTQGRKFSVGAENFTSDLSESLQVADGIADSAGVDSPAVAESSATDEGARKISVAAEAVTLEFVPETANSLTEASQSETVSIVPSDDADAVSVAAVTVTVGEFADTVSNTSNEQQKITSTATESVETGELAEPQQIFTENIETRSSLDDAGAKSHTDESISNDNFETGKSSAANSLEGSQTSITDDDSVVSVVTKEELTSRDAVAPSNDIECVASEVDLNSSTSQEKSTLPTDCTTKEDSSEGILDLKDGVTDITSRLEGINSFLDSLVRSLTPTPESGPIEEIPTELNKLSQDETTQFIPCPQSNQNNVISCVHNNFSCANNIVTNAQLSPSFDISNDTFTNSVSKFSSDVLADNALSMQIPESTFSSKRNAINSPSLELSESKCCSNPVDNSPPSLQISNKNNIQEGEVKQKLVLLLSAPALSESSAAAELTSTVSNEPSSDQVPDPSTENNTTLTNEGDDASNKLQANAEKQPKRKVSFNKGLGQAGDHTNVTAEENAPKENIPNDSVTNVHPPEDMKSKLPHSILKSSTHAQTSITPNSAGESSTATYRIVTHVVHPEPNVFTALNQGIGIENGGPKGQACISVYIDGEWFQM